MRIHFDSSFCGWPQQSSSIQRCILIWTHSKTQGKTILRVYSSFPSKPRPAQCVSCLQVIAPLQLQIQRCNLLVCHNTSLCQKIYLFSSLFVHFEANSVVAIVFWSSSNAADPFVTDKLLNRIKTVDSVVAQLSNSALLLRCSELRTQSAAALATLNIPVQHELFDNVVTRDGEFKLLLLLQYLWSVAGVYSFRLFLLLQYLWSAAGTCPERQSSPRNLNQNFFHQPFSSSAFQDRLRSLLDYCF
jgi:hypothetical protein